ncbi:protein kinase domain-containing protein [Streptomyces sp. S063]|uniref:protein kinase domain-containing protein n=1 Tax=Streptomyces sp. S063 TaxID=2005885 RepID=UPI0010084AF2|nr:protein kinase [Streptomyces sp. S063]
MEALRQDDPRRFGRFTALARFDEGASAVRYVARDLASGETALVTAARPELAAVPVFSRRFQAEARTADRLAGGWVAPPLDPGDAAETPADEPEPLWTAAGYVPALPLAEAIGIAGPLPERALRILGAGIAEILSRVHAAGSVLQGLAPNTVLLAADGPRLTAFGPLGAAASAEARPGGQLSVRLGYLTPEQIEGKEVSAASDLFVLGLLLAYAATGTTPFTEGPAEEATRRIAEDEPELDAVPEELRELIANCLAKDPRQRPTAGTVAAELALEGAAGLARGGWLPEPLAAAVADQEARVLALEVPEEGDATADSGTADVPAALEDARPTDPRALRKPADADAPAPARNTDGNTDGNGDGDGDAGEDRGTTRFLNTGPRPPRNDRPTTQLALPHELTAPQAPGALPAAHPAQPAAPLALPAGPVPRSNRDTRTADPPRTPRQRSRPGPRVRAVPAVGRWCRCRCLPHRPRHPTPPRAAGPC